MAITISGENNNDKILASDGVIDQLSGVNLVGVLTATTFSGDFTGNATGIITSSAIKVGLDAEAKKRFNQVINYLYTKPLLIMPVRHPVELFRSWMHYQKTIVNDFIKEEIGKEQFDGKLKIPEDSDIAVPIRE